MRNSAGVGQSGAVLVFSGRLRLTTTPLRTRRAAAATRSAVSRFSAPRSSCAPQRPQLVTESNSARELRRRHVHTDPRRVLAHPRAVSSRRADAAREWRAPRACSRSLVREANLRCTISATEPPTSIIAMLAPSTLSAPSDFENSPMPAATPRKAAAGIVVTEIATPTPMLARVSTASIPATPAASATRIVSASTCCWEASPISWIANSCGQQVEQVEESGDRRGEQARHGEADQQRDEPLADQPPSAQHQARAGRGDGEQVRRHRHRSDDQDLVLVDHPECRDHSGDGHEHEIADGRPCVDARLSEQVGPDEGDRFVGGRRGADRVEPQQRDVLGRNPESTDHLERSVGGRRADVGASRARCRRARRRRCSRGGRRKGLSSRSATSPIAEESPNTRSCSIGSLQVHATPGRIVAPATGRLRGPPNGAGCRTLTTPWSCGSRTEPGHDAVGELPPDVSLRLIPT